MKRLIHWLIVGILAASFSGCAIKPIEAPLTNTFSDLTEKLQPVKGVSPIRLPEQPAAETVKANGIEYLAFNQQAAQELIAYSTAAKANTEIAWELSTILNEQRKVQDNLLMAGKVMEQRANYLAFKWSTAETQLMNERREHQVDNALHRILIIILALVGL